MGLIAAATPSAVAASSAVEITKGGYVPKDTTIVVGDTVSFQNADSAAHEVTLKPTTGVNCSVTPLVVQPGVASRPPRG